MEGQPPSGDMPPEGANGDTYRPLNVRDALSYLDQVKLQFSDQPDVYNRFLDIMKDFKSQSLPLHTPNHSYNPNDTPGVIERVSTLFRGHPALISGFNTFLPPGYRIECAIDPNDPDLIRVTTPTGSSSVSGGSYFYQQQGALEYGQVPGGQGGTGGQYPPMSGAPAMSQAQPPARKPPVEFDHAINYVNKIKNRFANDPDTYKQFLEILQTYHNEQKPIGEVYAQVQVLFSGAPDLLDEFKAFLPDLTGNSHDSNFFMGSNGDYGQYGQHVIDGYGKKGMVGAKKKRGGMASDRGGRAKRTKQDTKGPSDLAMLSPTSTPIAFDAAELQKQPVTMDESEFFERIKRFIGNKQTYTEFLKVLTLYSQQIMDRDTLVERVEGFIGGNRELFEWFKQYMHWNGGGELQDVGNAIPKPDLATCKAFGPSYRLLPVAWQEQPCSGRDGLCWEVLNDKYVSHPTWASEDSGFVASKKNQYEEALHRCEEERYEFDLVIEANLHTIKLLDPIAVQLSQMSAEEKSRFRLAPGFGSESKSISQRTIRKLYDKDRAPEILDALYNNPAHAVPVVLDRLRKKDHEWRGIQTEWNKVWRDIDTKNFYKALDFQGITFKTNDKKAIASRALVVEIENLRREQREKFEDPRVLPRYQYECTFDDPDLLKDITRLIYSYLERGGGFTSNDRERVRKFIKTFVPLFFDVPTVVPENLKDVEEEPSSEEEEDENRSVTSYQSETEDYSSSPASTTGTRNVDHSEGLLKEVLTRKKNTKDNKGAESPTSNSQAPSELPEEEEATKMDVDVAGHNEYSHALEDAVKEEVAEEAETPVESHPNEDDRKEEALAKAEAAVVLGTSTTMEELGNELQEVQLDQDLLVTSIRNRNIFDFFGHNTFYAFFRLYQLLYERLYMLKTYAQDVPTNPLKYKQENKTAEDLGVNNTRFKAVFDADLLKQGRYYELLLDLIDKLFDGDVDQLMCEEATRYLFGIEGYVIFTVDKVVQQIIRQIQTIATDPKSKDLITLFEKDHVKSNAFRLLSAYRIKADEIAGPDENLYRIIYNTQTHTLTIQLLGKDDYTDDYSPEDRYDDYVSSYMDWGKMTEGVDSRKLRPTFMNRQDFAEGYAVTTRQGYYCS